MVFDERGIRHYQLNDATISFIQKENSTIGTSIDILIEAVSYDPYNKAAPVICS